MKSSRRQVLRGAAGGGLLAPFLPLLSRRVEAAGAPRRLLLVFTPNGHPRYPHWGAAGTERDFKLGTILQPLEPFKSDLIVMDGIDMKSWEAQTPRPPNDHPPVLGHVLTANDVIDPQDGSKSANSSTWFAGHVSIDQFIASRVGAQTKFPSLVIGVKSGGALGRLSYRAARDPVPPQNDPKKLFDSVFQWVTGDPAQAERLRLQKKSVIDGVSAELTALQRQVPASDRQKIEAHLDRLRAIEARLANTRSPTGCSPTPPADGMAGESSFVVQGRQQMDNLALVLACDLTRVINLQWSVASTGQSYPWTGETEAHHGLAHSTASGIAARQATVSRWYGEQFKYLLQKLKEIPEGNGTVLDNTAVLWYNEHGNPLSGHPRSNMPFLLAGGGAHFKTGRYLQFAKKAHNDLFVSLAHFMGLDDVKTFGRADVCTGPLPGLT